MARTVRVDTGDSGQPRIGRPVPGRPSSSRLFSTVGAVRSKADLEEQLQVRLRLLAALCSAIYAAGAAVFVAMDRQMFFAPPSNLFTEVPYPGALLGVAVADGVLAVLLAPRRRFELRRLRIIEGIIFGMTVAMLLLIFPPNLKQAIGTSQFFVIISAFGFSAHWVMLIMLYAVFVPNTWQRCATVLAFFFVLAMGPDVVIVLRSALIAPLAGGSYLTIKAIMISGAAVFGVYGAYRIDILRQDVAEARKIGQYVLGRQLGSGGMGEVYLAEHQFLRRPCAVKLIRTAHGENATALERFEREVQATAALTHPNTVQIYDYGRTDDGTFFYAMEYLPGESLDELVTRTGRVPAARAVHLLAQIAGSLREAHTQGLVHRDVKPSNVIITERGGIADFAKLLDFGLVASSGTTGDGKLTEAGMLIGTPAFMSPEQCGGEENIGPASDIYSVGALGYFLLSGEAPFAGKTPMQMLAAHLYETPKPLAEHGVEVSADVEGMIARCLAKRPADRFASAAELERTLLGLCSADGADRV